MGLIPLPKHHAEKIFHLDEYTLAVDSHLAEDMTLSETIAEKPRSFSDSVLCWECDTIGMTLLDSPVLARRAGLVSLGLGETPFGRFPEPA